MTADNTHYMDIAKDFVNKMIGKNYESCIEMLDETMSSLLTEEALKTGWDSIVAGSGQVKCISEVKISDKVNTIADVIVEFSNEKMDIKLTIDEKSRISGMTISKYNPSELPSGLVEIDIVVGKDTKWPIAGKITTSEKGISDIAVVLVQGSGASNMDETILANSPFRDIAWSLCQKGIDSIRYDKRTFTHGPSMVTIKDLSVEQEVIEDAIFAGRIMKEAGYKKVFLVGHSLGGMLAPRIASESSGLFDGLVIMAGSPRKLTDIIIGQSEDMISKIPDQAVRDANNAANKIEFDKIQMLSKWSDEEAQNNTIFGANAYYFKEMEKYDVIDIARSLTCPMLFLQGDSDFQVKVDRDFQLYKDAFQDRDNVKFVLYKNLNHLFMTSGGPGSGTLAEYNTPSHVEEVVTDDIVSFLNKY